MHRSSRFVILLSIALLAGPTFARAEPAAATERPNILFCIADDWSVQAGVYGDTAIKTPTFDRLGREGLLFTQAYVSSPSCTPSRGAILTGQWHWRLNAGGNLYGPLPIEIPLYTDLLEESGYFVGYTRKGWGPGKHPHPRNPAGNNFKSFGEFLAQRPRDKPFCFWFGSTDPHRSYKRSSETTRGFKLDAIQVPAIFPDAAEVRQDLADYYAEVQKFDGEVGEHIEQVRVLGELNRTVIVMTSDNGMPFPRAKSNIYDMGVRVPLAIHWPGRFEGGHRVDDFVSTTDFAPTFLELAGLEIPEVMTGRSLLPLLKAGRGGHLDPKRDSVLIGKERHVPGQEIPDSGGYPCRGLRSDDYLVIRNFTPDRWPAGTPDYQKSYIPKGWYADCDNGPTKSYMIDNKDKDEAHKHFYELAFAKRPEWELYDLKKDPDQMVNIAGDPARQALLASLQKALNGALEKAGDPRVIGEPVPFDEFPYGGGGPSYPNLPKKTTK